MLNLPVANFALLLIVIGAGDVMSRRIPNRLVLLLALSFLPAANIADMPMAMVAQHVGVGVILLTAGYFLFSLGYLGGGDAKLIAAAGLWFGFPSMIVFLLYAALAGGVVAAATWAWLTTSLEAGLFSSRLRRLLPPFAPVVPYGAGIAAGAILTLPSTWWMTGQPGTAWLTLN